MEGQRFNKVFFYPSSNRWTAEQLDGGTWTEKDNSGLKCYAVNFELKIKPLQKDEIKH